MIKKEEINKRTHVIRLDFTHQAISLLPYNKSTDNSSCNIITSVRSYHSQYLSTHKGEEIIQGKGHGRRGRVLPATQHVREETGILVFESYF